MRSRVSSTEGLGIIYRLAGEVGGGGGGQICRGFWGVYMVFRGNGRGDQYSPKENEGGPSGN